MINEKNLILLKEMDFDDLDILIILKNETDAEKFEKLFTNLKKLDLGITDKLENMKLQLDFDFVEIDHINKIFW